jgi:hypothetical protein
MKRWDFPDEMGRKFNAQLAARVKPACQHVLFAEIPVEPSSRIIIGKKDVVNAEHRSGPQARHDLGEEYRHVTVLERPMAAVEKR